MLEIVTEIVALVFTIILFLSLIFIFVYSYIINVTNSVKNLKNDYLREKELNSVLYAQLREYQITAEYEVVKREHKQQNK